jgi:hypothetical protein
MITGNRIPVEMMDELKRNPKGLPCSSVEWEKAFEHCLWKLLKVINIISFK